MDSAAFNSFKWLSQEKWSSSVIIMDEFVNRALTKIIVSL